MNGWLWGNIKESHVHIRHDLNTLQDFHLWKGMISPAYWHNYGDNTCMFYQPQQKHGWLYYPISSLTGHICRGLWQCYLWSCLHQLDSQPFIGNSLNKKWDQRGWSFRHKCLGLRSNLGPEALDTKQHHVQTGLFQYRTLKILSCGLFAFFTWHMAGPGSIYSFPDPSDCKERFCSSSSS